MKPARMGPVEPIYAEFGRWVRARRELAGLTVEELGAVIALSRSSVSNIERGCQRLLHHDVVRIRATLVSPEFAVLVAVADQSREAHVAAYSALLPTRPKRRGRPVSAHRRAVNIERLPPIEVTGA